VWSQTTLAETFPDHPSSPFFPQTPILFLPPPLLVSFECLPTSQEVLSIAFGKLSRFNILSWLLASAEGLISASTRCPKPRSTTFSEFFGFGVFFFFLNHICSLQEVSLPHAPCHGDPGFLCSAWTPAASPSDNHASKRVLRVPASRSYSRVA